MILEMKIEAQVDDVTNESSLSECSYSLRHEVKGS